MSKNMTRKGLALGLGAALAASTFGIAPANAAGQDDKTFVSLSPRTGTEYTVLLDQYFDLKANTVSSLAGTAGKDLKFLVSDPAQAVFVDQSQETSTPQVFTAAAADGANQLDSITYDETGGASEKITTATVDTTNLNAGEKLFLYGFTDTTAAANLNGELLTQASNTTATYNVDPGGGDDISYKITGGSGAVTKGLNTRETILANAAIDADLFESATVTSQPGKITTDGRASDGTFVINTETNANANDRLLRLVTNSAGTYSVTVTAWVDDNDNGVIDPTEYTSPERTITFQKPSDIVGTTTISPVVGSETLTASVTTTPVLNGEQVLLQDKNFLNAAFTRSLSADTVYAEADKGTAPYDSATAVWNNTSKEWTLEVSLDADAAGASVNAQGGVTGDTWTDIAAPNSGADEISKAEVSTSGVVTITTDSNHLLRAGDKITISGVDTGKDTGLDIIEVTAGVVTPTGAKTFTYSLPSTTTKPTTAFSDAAIDNDNDTYTVVTYADNDGLIDRVGSETYTAQAVIAAATGSSTYTAISTQAETGVTAAATVTAVASTVGSATVQGKSFTDTSTNTTLVLAGTKSVPVRFTALDEDGDALGAGRPVVVSLSASGTADVFRVNGKTADTVLTDSNGQATVTITALNGLDGAKLEVTGNIENAASAAIDLEWDAVSYGLYDMSTTDGQISAGTVTRAMQEESSYTLDLKVMDQWYNAAPADEYRLKVYGDGVSARYVTLVDGAASLTITDTGVFGSRVDTDVDLEKISGTTVLDTTPYDFQASVTETFKVNLGADGSTLFGNAVDASNTVAAKGLVELDKRIEDGTTPNYTNKLVLNGSVVNAANSAGREGAIVTVSGPSNILFSSTDDLVAKRGSLTFLAGADGKFEIEAYSTTAQEDTEITFTSNGASETIDVTFTGQSIGEATSLEIVAADFVSAASTFQVIAKLTDDFGNGVSTGTSNALKLTKTGAGITFGTLPDDTDVNGEATFNVLLGANDSGTITITASYDQNDDGDFTDAKDITVTKTITIGEAPADTKVNAGSFKGYVAVYAKGYEGQRLSAKIGNDWVIVPSLASDFERVTDFTGAGVDIAVRIYIDRVLVDTIPLTTK